MAWLLPYRLVFSAKPAQPNGAVIEICYPLFATAVGTAIAR